MAGLDLATCEAKLQEYLDAETAVLSGRIVEVDGDRLTLADLDQIQAGVDVWNTRVAQRSGSRRSVRRMGKR
jgi:hypothetical protein